MRKTHFSYILMLLLGFMAINSHGKSVEMPSAYSLEVGPKTVAKLPTPKDFVNLPADLFFSTFEKKQSFQTIAEIDNPELKAYLAELNKITLAIMKTPQKQKSIVTSTAFSLDDESLSWVAKCIIRKSNNQLNITITPYVLPNTDPEAIAAIINFCNALFPQLTFMQKHGKTIGVITTLITGIPIFKARHVIRREVPEFYKRTCRSLENIYWHQRAMKMITQTKNNGNLICPSCKTKIIEHDCCYIITDEALYSWISQPIQERHLSCLIPIVRSALKVQAQQSKISFVPTKTLEDTAPTAAEIAELNELKTQHGNKIKSKLLDHESICPICQDEISEGELGYSTIACTCKDAFHENCLLSCFESQTFECPPDPNTGIGEIVKTSTACPVCNDGIKKV
jgi:hypothetical protein